MLTAEQEATVKDKLRKCVQQHQATLRDVSELQRIFSASIFAQFTVSLVIICVTAFQLASVRPGQDIFVRALNSDNAKIRDTFTILLRLDCDCD